MIHWNKGKCLLTTAHKTLDLQANALSKNHVACMLWNGGGCKLLVDQHGLVTDQQTIKGNMPTLGQCPSGIPLIRRQTQPSVARNVFCGFPTDFLLSSGNLMCVCDHHCVCVLYSQKVGSMIFAIWAREQANTLHMIGIPWNVLSAIFFPQDYTSQQDPSAQYPYEGLDHAKATWHHSLDSRFVVLQDQSHVQSHQCHVHRNTALDGQSKFEAVPTPATKTRNSVSVEFQLHVLGEK